MNTNTSHRGHTKHRFGHMMIAFGMFSWIALSVAVNWAPGTAQAVSIGSVLSLSNSQRSANGLPSYTANSSLNAAAQAKAQHMLNNDYWAHTAPDGTTGWNFINGQGYAYQTAGENLALTSSPGGSATDVVNGWMNSTGHRANLLNTTFTEVGHGVVFAPNGVGEHEFASYLVVALYALPNTPTPPPAPDPPAEDPAPDPEPEPQQQTTAPTPQTTEPIAQEAEDTPEPEPEEIAESEPIPENQSVAAEDETPTSPVVPVASINPTKDRLISPEIAVLLATVATTIIAAGVYFEIKWVKRHGHIQHIHFPHL